MCVLDLFRPSRLLAAALVVELLALCPGCVRLGPIVSRGTLRVDASDLDAGDLAGPGPLQVVARGLHVTHRGRNLPVVLFRPEPCPHHAPSVVFLPGRMAPEDQYESYARALASRGVIVAVRGWYSWFRSDSALARDAVVIADWLVQVQGAHPERIGLAGHSMGGKDAVLAAVTEPGFAAVVAIDPDDNGPPSVVDGPIERLTAPLLLIGAEVAWQAAHVCAPKDTNYERFFERAPAGTVELTLLGADHVQVMDDPERFGYSICRCGTADSRAVRNMARRATVGFFVRHLLGRRTPPLALEGVARMRVKGPLRSLIVEPIRHSRVDPGPSAASPAAP